MIIDILYYPMPSNAAKVTFKGIASLVRHCSRLQHLFLPFTATSPGPALLDKIRSEGISNTAIHRFNPGWTVIRASDTRMVAELLLALFPNLAGVNNNIHPALPQLSVGALWAHHIELWEEVAELMSGRDSCER